MNSPTQDAPGPVLDRQQRPTQRTGDIDSAIGNLARANSAELVDPNFGSLAPGLSAIGGAIAQTGSVIGAIALKRAEAITKKQVFDHGETMANSRVDFETQRQGIDPAEWNAKWEEISTRVESDIMGAENLTPAAREQLSMQLAGFKGESARGVRLDADKQIFAESKSVHRVESSRAIENQDWDRLEELNQSGEAEGIQWPHESAGYRDAFKAEGKVQQAETIAVSRVNAPAKTLEMLEGGEWKLTELERIQEIQKTKREVHFSQNEKAAEMSNSIFAGTMTTTDQIDALGETLRPEQHDALRTHLGRVMERKVDGFTRTPAEQTRMAGQIEGLLLNYQRPDEADQDTAYITGSGIISNVADPNARKEYQRRLDDLRDGNPEALSFADSTMKTLFDDGAFGEIPGVSFDDKTLGSFIDDGFLEDSDKLMSLGMTKGDADTVTKGKGRADRIKRFKEHYVENSDSTASTWDQTLANTIRDGKSLSTSMQKTENVASRIAEAAATEKVETTFGRATIEMNTWMRANPQAKPEAIKAKASEISRGEGSRTLKQSMTTPRPSGQGERGSMGAAGRAGETSFNKLFTVESSNAPARALRAKQGGITVLLDSNYGTGKGFTSPMMVIPNNATTGQRKAAQAYVDRMVSIHQEKFGRKLKGRVVTRAENGRGRSNAFHTEGFAVHDTEFTDWYQTPNGLQTYKWALEPLSAIPGVQFTLPHGGKDSGAEFNGVNEVDFARMLSK